MLDSMGNGVLVYFGSDFFMQGTPLTTIQKSDFLQKLRSRMGHIAKAAQAAKVSRSTIYNHRNTDPDFKAAWDDVIDEICDDAEAELHRRAVKGVLEPIYYKGKKVGSIRKFSDSGLQFLLRAKRPEIYRERFDIKNHVSAVLDFNFQAAVDEIYGKDDSDNPTDADQANGVIGDP